MRIVIVSKLLAKVRSITTALPLSGRIVNVVELFPTLLAAKTTTWYSAYANNL